MKRIILPLLAIATLGGCASNQIGARSYLDVNKDTGIAQPGSRVFIWNSDYSAGIGNSNGQCAQGALTATASSLGAALDVVGKVKAGVDYSEAIMALNVSTVQTSYANLGYFYLCQIALNDHAGGKKLSPDDIKEMFIDVGKTASILRSTAEKPATIISPKQASAVQALFQSKADSGEGQPSTEEIQKTLEDNQDAKEPTEEIAVADDKKQLVKAQVTPQQAEALKNFYEGRDSLPTLKEVEQVVRDNPNNTESELVEMDLWVANQ